jgi:hypothetical protein
LAPRKTFLLRLPPELMDELNRWAQDELRSLNAQMEYLLRDAVRKQRGAERALPEAEESADEDGEEPA